jgi:alkanesulfonate monooxygenase SsuD/methylene tetrahydromethanopterin reductase-like flavin-dependent oxidoreductase (luciferase family)
MSGLRAGLGLPGADAGAVQRAARLAEDWNVESLWIGDPAHHAHNADDTYVMVAAAAAAAATAHVRLGVFLSARSSAPPLRVAEDIAVVDQISSGRLSVVFSPPDGEPADAAWLADLERIAEAPRGWDLGDGRRMPVTPPPAQPTVPMAVFERGDSAARPLAATWSPVLLAVDWPDATTPPSPADLLRLKAGADDAGAAEVILLADAAADLDAVFAVVGTVVAPCLRAADHEVGILALDATRWLHERAALHRPPD